MIIVKYCPVLKCMQLHFCQMYLYSNITGLCWEQFYFFLCKNWDVLRCWLVPSNSPRVQKYPPSAFSAGTESKLKILNRVQEHRVFSGFSSRYELTSGGEKISIACQAVMRGLASSRKHIHQWWVLLQMDRLQQNTHQLINLCQN